VRKPAGLLGALAILVGALAAVMAVAESTAQTQPPATLTVYAGQGSGSIAENDFIGDPNVGGNGVRVALGTTVFWSLQSDEVHTVTFPVGNPVPDIFVPQPEDLSRPGMLNPQIFVPSLPNGPWDGTTFVSAELTKERREVSLTFARTGRYQYLCVYHPTMTGTVDVVAPGSPLLTTQSQIDAQAAAMDAVRQGQAASIYATRNSAARVEGARGTDLWFVRAGTSWRGESLDIQAFLPSEVTIPQGDTVVWYVDHQQPHTVTFRPTEGTQSAELYVLQGADGTALPPPAPGESLAPEVAASFLEPEGAPRLVLGPGAQRTTNPIHDSRSAFSSGLMGEHPRVAIPMEKVWALTFNTPGTYSYVCLLHEEQGMKGTINVQPR
jgi:plastocyanin